MRLLNVTRFMLHVQAIVALTLMVASASWAKEIGADDPERVVGHLQDSLIKTMQDGKRLGYRGRFELLAPVIEQSHDFDFIARTILGAGWTDLNASQQHTFMDVFRKLSIGTYAGWFKSHAGERFEILEQQAMPRDQVMVRSRLVLPKGNPVRFDYIMRREKDGWRIVNILADGVSDLALKRTEYRAILQRDGFQTLVDMLREKIALTEKE